MSVIWLLLACGSPPDTDACATPTWWYADRDGDGFGSAIDRQEACEAPPVHGSDSSDCNDTFPHVNPGAEEVCDGIDDNCDGAVDPDGSPGSTTWHVDADGDGFGDPDSTVEACEQRGGLVTDTTDCDDADAERNGGNTEVCGNGVDDDCDGGSGDCAPSGTIDLDSGLARWSGVAAGDNAGRAVAFVGDVDGDGIGDVLVGATGVDRNTSATRAGAAYLWLGPHSGEVSLRAGAAVLLGAEIGDFGGHAVAGGEDLDGDGAIDLVVSRIYGDDGGADGGVVNVVPGATRGQHGLEEFTALYGEASGDHAGSALAIAGDLVIGADGVGDDAGAVYLAALPVAAGSLGGATRLDGAAGSRAGAALVVCDTDGDGTAEIGVGAPGGAGGVYLVGDTASDAPLGDVGEALTGDADGDEAGASLACGDVDGDGHGDLAVGAPGRSAGAGAVWLLQGPVAAGPLTSADAVVEGLLGTPGAGHAVALGDIDGDGLADLLVGAADTSSTLSATWMWLGPIAGALPPSSAKATWASASDMAGGALAIGDADGDRYGDLLIGAPDVASNTGAATLFVGQGL